MCFADNVRPADSVRGVDLVIAPILICMSCAAIINKAAYDALSETPLESAQRSDIYLGHAASSEEVDSCAPLFDDLARFVDIPFDGTFCDFGAGNGRVAIHAARQFKKVIACEWDDRAMKESFALMGQPNNLSIARDIAESVDLLFMWHVLEHIPNPTDFWQARAHILSDRAVIFLQIPLFRANHVVSSHYVFHTESSLTWWAERLGFKVKHLGYDHDNGFLALVACRPS